jgi:hypothetical protein
MKDDELIEFVRKNAKSQEQFEQTMSKCGFRPETTWIR